MTNYNPKNIKRQLELPGMETAGIESIARQLGLPKIELEAMAEASPQPKQKKGLRQRTYGIIGAIALAIGAASYGTNYTLNEMEKGFNALGAIGEMTNLENITKSFSEESKNFANKYLWKNTDSEDYSNRFKTDSDKK
jgi:hypothetical protein